MSVFIIAEAGVNHNGSLILSKQLVDIAKECGADCVKFQTVEPKQCVSKNLKKAEYQIENTGSEESQLEMIKKLALTFEDFIELKEYCYSKKIMFCSTPFDINSVKFLNELDVPFWKIPSGEITNLPYLIEIAKTHKPIIMSTGMSNLDEIRQAIDILKNYGAGEIKLLHCNTEYPTPFEDVNLRVIKTLKKEFGVEIGYSDHTEGIEASIGAVAVGATIIEKHFTLDKTMNGPDHKASLDPSELYQMIKSIRNIEKALGSEVKNPTKSELKNIDVVRKSIIASRNIKQGEAFSEYNITTKRPGTGISPMRWFEVLGQKASRNFKEDELIEF